MSASASPLPAPNTDLIATGGKSGLMFLFHRDSMGHLGPDNTSTVQSVQATLSSIFNIAVWDNQDGPIAYEFDANSSLKAYRITNGQLGASPFSKYSPPVSSLYAGLAVTANGGTNGTGIVWLTTGDYSSGDPVGTLHALDASDLSIEYWNSGMSGARDSLGWFAKFVAPTVANGRVYVPTFSNTLAIYGLLPQGPSAAPRGQITAVVSSASFLTSPIAPGELVTIFGANLGPQAPADGEFDATDHLSESLSTAQVLFDGLQAPLLYASSDQFNAIVPFGVAGPSTQLQVFFQGQVTSSTSVPVAPAAPALFSLDRSGGGGGAILNHDGTVNTRDNPAPRGSVVVLYATGGGVTKPASEDGAITRSPPYPLLKLPVSVFIGDQPGEVLYAGAAPGIVAGVLQINVRIPKTAQPTFAAQITLKIGDYASPTAVTLAVD